MEQNLFFTHCGNCNRKNGSQKPVVHKDSKGTTKTIHLTVEGPVSVAGCTTQESIYEDNSNRNFLLYIDESAEQDQRIMQYQRLASAGKLNEQEQIEAAELLQNVQRVLKPIRVINPFAEYLELPRSVFKPRRTNSHYFTVHRSDYLLQTRSAEKEIRRANGQGIYRNRDRGYTGSQRTYPRSAA